MKSILIILIVFNSFCFGFFESQVDIFSGILIEEEEDFSLPGPYGVKLQRSYAPMARCMQKIAQGWQFNMPDLFEKNSSRQKIPQDFQCEVHALHDEKMRLRELQFLSKGNKERIAEWQISYDDSSCTVQSSLGDTLVYTLKKWDVDTYVLSEITKNGNFICAYSYMAHPSERVLLISSKIFACGDRLEVEYFLEDPKAISFGRVKKLTLLKENQQTSDQSCSFTYSTGLTKVSYQNGTAKHFTFNYANELQAIEEWSNGALIKKEELIWEDGKLISKAIYDNLGVAKQCFLFEYDSRGNIVKESLAGTLSGYEKCALTLQNGKPCSKAEIYSKFYSYNEQNFLIEEREENGSCRQYEYHANGLLGAIFSLDQQEIKARRFYFYDNNLCLIKEVYDNGSSGDFRSLENVTFREEKDFGPFHKLGMPLRISESKFDPLTQEMVLTSTQELAYSEDGLLLEEKNLSEAGTVLRLKNWRYEKDGTQLYAQENDKEIRQSFDALGRLIYQWQSGDTFEIFYRYCSEGLSEAKKKYFDGRSESTYFQYDARGNLIAKCDYLGNETKYLYDSQNRKIAEIAPAFDQEYPCTAFSYDSFNNPIQIINAKGQSLTTVFNSRFQPTLIVYPDGTEEKFYYYLDGKLKQECKRDKQFVQYFYDAFGNILNQSSFDSHSNLIETIEYGYIGGNLLYELSSLHGLKKYAYDLHGNIIQIESGHCSKFSYDPWGNILEKQELWPKYPEMSQIAKIQEKTIYNHLGECCFAENSRPAKWPSKKGIAINSLGQKFLELDFIDENGNPILIQYNAYNLPVLEIKKDPFGNVLYEKQLSYDTLGNKISENFHAKGQIQVTKWIYGPLNRLEETIEAFGTLCQKSHRYFYNDYAQLIEIQKPDGTLLFFEYNASGRVCRHYSSDQTIDYSFAYDLKGNLIQIHDSIHSTISTLTYNEDNKLACEVLANGLSLKNEYDCSGRRIGLYLPDGSSVQYLYDTLYLKEVVRKGKDGKATYSYSLKNYNLQGLCVAADMIGNLGEVQSASDGSKLITPYHISLKEKDSIVLKHPQGIERLQYAQDASGQIIAESGCYNHSYCYDSFGNRMFGGDGKYDVNGNLIAYGNFEYVYDALNRLIKIKQDGRLLVQYFYDCFHRRIAQISQKKTCFLYDGLSEIGCSTSDGEIQELRLLGDSTRGEAGATLAIELNGEIYAPLHDVIGSIIGIVSVKNRQIEELYCHSAFGEEKMLAGLNAKNPWRYSGKRVDDETGLVFFGRRYYSPEMGRWLTPDPAGFCDGPNLYLFAKNNPIQNRDAYGLFSFNSFLHVILNPLEYIDDCMGKMFHYFSGYYIKECNSGIFGNGEISDKVRVTMINGMLTDEYWLLLSAKALSYTHGGVNIHYVHRPPTNFLLDAIRSYMIKNGCISPHARMLAQMWKDLIQEMGGEKAGGSIIHYSHSIGTCETMAALSLLSEPEKKMIKVYSFGSPCLSNKRNYQIHHYVSVRDGVCLLDFPYLIKAARGENPYVTFVGTFLGYPFVDHLFGAKSYMDVWSAMGKTFVEWYGSLL